MIDQRFVNGRWSDGARREKELRWSEAKHTGASPKAAIAAQNLRCNDTIVNMGIGGGIAVALSFISCIWLPATLLCCLPWVQKRE